MIPSTISRSIENDLPRPGQQQHQFENEDSAGTSTMVEMSAARRERLTHLVSQDASAVAERWLGELVLPCEKISVQGPRLHNISGSAVSPYQQMA